MRLLLDTHALVWLLVSPSLLSARVRDEILHANSSVNVSAVTAWEIATKVRLGKMSFDETFLLDFDARVKALGFEPIAVSAAHAIAGARLPGPHRDPFDRLLAGQALIEGLVIATKDAHIPSLDVPTLW